jgi:hypothetical protein
VCVRVCGHGLNSQRSTIDTQLHQHINWNVNLHLNNQPHQHVKHINTIINTATQHISTPHDTVINTSTH